MSDSRSPESGPNHSLGALARTSLYIGLTGYGGPAILGHMKRVFVGQRKWVTEQDFLTGLSLSQMLPGATGVSLIEFIGYQLNGAWGAVVAPLLFIAPAFVFMTILSSAYFAYGQVPLVHSLFTGLGAVVVALLANALVTLGRSAIKDAWAGAIALAAFLAEQLFHIHVLAVIVSAALVGLALFSRTATKASAPPTPTIAHRSGRLWLWWVVGLSGIGIAAAATSHMGGTRLALAMARVGALAFGGGFTSIPLMHSEAVVAHHWVSNRQFLDGIALGQVTPGPVLITATFLGYHVAGVLGAVLGTLAIFAPSCAVMFLMARQHERVKDLTWVRAMIRGVVAAFIGVLLSVAIHLGAQSITDLKTAALAVAAGVVVLVWKRDPLWVIIGGALVSPWLFS